MTILLNHPRAPHADYWHWQW